MNQSFPLIEAKDARIDQQGVPLVEHLSICANGSRVVLLGPTANAIFLALSAQADIVAGTLSICGLDVTGAEHFAQVGIALFDPQLPPKFTVHELLCRNFYLTGLNDSEAKSAATAALNGLSLNNLTSRRIDTLALPERRAAILAQAMLPSAKVLIAQSPLESLEGPAAQYVLAILGKISQTRKVLATSARFDTAGPDRELSLGADHVVVFDGNHPIWQGNPNELLTGNPLYSLRVRGDCKRFTARLRELQCQVFDNDERPRVSLPQGQSTTLFFTAASETEALVIEMIPLFHPSPSA